MATTRNPTSSGTGSQESGGMGDPNVGTGWTNLTNFLNPTNLEYGAGMIGPAEAMDPANGRGVEQPAFENWLKSASGNTSQKPSDAPAPDKTTPTPPAPLWSTPVVPIPNPAPTGTVQPPDKVSPQDTKQPTGNRNQFNNLNAYLAW